MTWEALLDGALLERADGAATAITEALTSSRWDVLTRDFESVPDDDARGALPLGLHHGRPGVAVLHAERGDRATARALLAATFDGLRAARLDAGLLGGLAGIAWSTERVRAAHVAASDPEGDDLDEATRSFDDVLRGLVEEWPGEGEWELTFGLVGLGVYALERLPRPSAVATLELVCQQMEARAVAVPHGIAWLSPLGHCELGMTHGLAGAIAFLARVHGAGVARARVASLLDRAVPTLLACEREGAWSHARFPAWTRGTEVSAASRAGAAGWATGDLGIAAALIGAARVAGEASWERRAVAIAGAYARTGMGDPRVMDASLAGGSAGIAHLFNRIAQATGDEACRDAARAWFARTLDLRDAGRAARSSIAGIHVWHDDPDGGGFRIAPGLLGGAAGTALALMAASSGVAPSWDRVLLAA